MKNVKQIKRASPIPFYGAAAVIALYALVFPLYRLVDYLILLAVGAAAVFGLRLVFKGTVETVELPAEPISTGDADIDALLREGEIAVAEMKKLHDAIAEPSVRSEIAAIIDVTDKIFKDVIDDPTDYRAVRRFADFYLPTTMKLLYAYERFGRGGATGESIDATLARIEDALRQIHASYEKQYDALFKNQALDIETDIMVLEALLKRDGLLASEFAV